LYIISKDKVRLHMNKKGINTQKELAEHMSISKNQLSMLLSTHFNPIKSSALKLCEALGTNLEEIMFKLKCLLMVQNLLKIRNKMNKSM
jgi:DNA (cytosine-5)-methyltransferase 1